MSETRLTKLVRALPTDGTTLGLEERMTALVRDLGPSFSNFSLEVADGRTGGARKKNDAQMGIRELEVLRDVDLVAPPEAAALAEPFVKQFRGELGAGDHLRLPQPRHFDGPSMRSAVGRILATDTSKTPGGDSDAVVKEERMLRVLRALEQAVDHIQSRAMATHR